jgi:hypothetical protein
MANRNRTAGCNYERQISNELKEMGYKSVTARYESRSTDDSGVDLVTDFPLAPQMKVSINQPNVHKLLTETSAEIIFYKRVEKADKRFVSKGEYVMMKKEDFYKLIK